ncbi:NUDIX hydrolase domain-like protein [Suillus occidentalis]|nr:NUDIX hydrolase domain-like protein [Suillus occidentalis]
MNRSLHLSESFVISCGTVTLDIDRSKVLVIYLRKTGEYCLPKGRKDVGEQLEATAVRETYEETGYNIELLPLQLTTLATFHGNGDFQSAIPGGVTEPVAVTQRTTQGVLKIIFWYAARGDSCAIRQMNTTEQDSEDFDAVWCPMDEAVQLLTFHDDKTITARVTEAARGGGSGSHIHCDVSI